MKLSALKEFESGNYTVRDILAAKLKIDPSKVEEFLNSSKGRDFTRSIGSTLWPIKSFRFVQNLFISNLDSKAHFQILEIWNHLANSFLIFDKEQIRIEFTWVIAIEANELLED